MANPPIANRRPGVDASIVQADWVRGYDGPQVGDDPLDIIVSNGQNEVDLRVADILVWNRTDDREQPMFILVPGSDITTGDRFETYAGDLADPNGVITSPLGSFYISNNPAGLWQNQDGADTWKKISDDLGGENLEETLVIGNSTGNNSIILSDAVNAFIIGAEDTTGGDGADARVLGGTASGVTGDGGAVLLTGGLSTGGATGRLDLITPTSGGTGSSGSILLQTGSNLVGGNAGEIVLRTGSGIQGGEILLESGDGANPGGDRGGRVQLLGGNSPADGDGGRVNIAGGSPGSPINFSNSFNPGRGGNLNFFGGNSAGSEIGGGAFLIAGKGGPGGGIGGDVILQAGQGGGGADDGKIRGNGIFLADNYPRDNGDPNVLGTPGDEGSIFQRSTGGLGQAYINTDGTPTGWQQLLTAGGGIVSALTQIQWGSLQGSSDSTNKELAADGTFYGVVGGGNDIVYQVTGTRSMTQGADNTPALNVTATAGNTAGLFLDTILSRNSKTRIVFKASNINDNVDERFFCGIMQAGFGNEVPAQLSTNNPGGNWYGVWKKTNESNFRYQAQFAGNDSTLSSVTVTPDAYYFVFDIFPDADGGVTVKILDENFVELDSHTFSPLNSLIADATFMRPLVGVGSAGPAKSISIHAISVVTRIDLAEAAFAGGLSGLASPLSEVLMVGNETGGTDMIFNQGDSIQGTTDGNGIDGSTLLVRSGTSTNLTGFSGNVSVFSEDTFLAVTTGGTGSAFFTSGSVADFTNTASGSTGGVFINSGLNFGVSGTTGDLTLSTGSFGFGGGGALATTGDILIAPGSFSANPSNPGTIDIRGGSTTLNGVTGGGVGITSGENTINGDSGSLAFVTADSAVDGSTGNILITAGQAGTNSGNGGNTFLFGGDVQAAGAIGGVVLIGGGQPVPASGADGGAVFLYSGNSEVGQGKNIEYLTGGSTVGGMRGGDHIFNVGTGPGGDGTVIINGKLTVTGLIDPTGLVLTGQGAVPAVANPGEGVIWVDNTGAPSILNFTDDVGTTIQLGSGGGGGTLAATLALGNNTGANPIEIDAALAAGVIGQDSAITDGGNVGILTGTSLGGAGGKGGDFSVSTGTPDAAGNGLGGAVSFSTSDGAGTGAGGDYNITTGAGGPTDARGGQFKVDLGVGAGTGNGGGLIVNGGAGGPGAGGDGGTLSFTPGAAGGGVAGTIELVGDTNITGDLQVTGTIDPTGVGFVGQGANPIPIVGAIDGSIWVDGAGDLFFTNLGAGDTNISQAIFGGAGPLAGVLAIGFTTGANPIEISLGSSGIRGANNAIGSGVDIVLTGGNSTGGGGDGGAFVFTGGIPVVGGGGSGSDFSPTLTPGDGAGTGGTFRFIAGAGDTTGAGGDFNATLGAGGSVSGDGGSFGLLSGSALGTGNGGSFSLALGAGGPGGGAGGKLAMSTGAGGPSGDGGDMDVVLGSATAVTGQGGRFRFTAGDSAGVIQGGRFEFAAGAGGVGGGAGDGGDLLFTGGTPLGTGAFGGVTLLGGGASALVGTPGVIQAVSSPSVGGGDGAALFLDAGSATSGADAGLQAGVAQAGSGADGGDAAVLGGAADGIGTGGVVLLRGGDGGAGAGSVPGNATVMAGSALVASGNGGGDVRIQGGAGDGAGVPGIITFGSAANGDTLDFDSPAMKMAIISLVGPALITWVGLGLTPFTTAPRVIQLTMAAPAASIPPGGTSVYVDLGVPIVGASFGVAFTVAPLGVIDVHITAYL